jgi:hypothetical protein
VVAEDISDFQIEGMSIGDSALDFFSLQELTDNIEETSYVKKDYTKHGFYKFSFFKKYDSVSIFVKSNDRKYVIQGLTGAVFYEGIKKCLNERDKIFSEMKNLFDKSVFIDESKSGGYKHKADESGESIIYSIYFSFESSAYINLKCADVSDAMTKINTINYALSRFICLMLISSRFRFINKYTFIK